MTAPYVIAELKPGETGGFSPRGAVKRLWQSRAFETIVSGPAETGKTWGCLQYLDALLWWYPGAQAVMARKVYKDLVGGALRTYRRIIGADSPIKPYGGEKPEWFDYPNGSRLWIAGFDNPGKALSSERDLIYVNQAEELELNDWETLTTRCTGRGAVMPYTRIFGDCNPGPPEHWIKHRAGMLFLESRHEDNPTLYDDAGNQTPQGSRTMAILDALTGVRKERLRHGRWVQAEGVVWEDFDPHIHVIKRFEIPKHWRRFRVVDFGFTNPFVCQWWAMDDDGRLYRYREIYHTKRLVEDHATGVKDEAGKVTQPGIVALSADERIEETICDHDAEDRATLDRYGIRTIPAFKAVTSGIESVASRLRKAGDGKPRLFFLEDSLVEQDEELARLRRPTKTEDEMSVYSWPKGQDGKPIKEEPLKVNDHGCDATRYIIAHVDDIGSQKIDYETDGVLLTG